MGQGATVLTPDDLLPLLDRLRARRLWVAFSGGLDSTALLLALETLRAQRTLDVHAVHANHGVHPDAADWSQHCAEVCERLDVPLTLLGPPDPPLPRPSPEARLREWRYGAFERLLAPGDALCTAHHREDQAETLLLALMRSSGPAGLAAMPEQRPLGPGRLVRPLLPWPRAALEALVRDRGVDWIEDPTNAGTDPDRNYLRHEILPRLRGRWPAADASLATTARLCAESQDLVDQATDRMLDTCTPAPGVLRLAECIGDEQVTRQLIRRWLALADCAPLPRARLENFLEQLTSAGDDRQPRLEWANHSLRRYRDELWLDSVDLGAPGGELTLVPRTPEEPLATSLENTGNLLLQEPLPMPPVLQGLTLRSRRAGDRLRPRSGGPARPLKQWLSRSPVPPWQRDAIPLFCRESEVLVIGDVVLDSATNKQVEAAGARLRWSPADAGLQWAWERCRASLLRVE